jgi:hypothetical protein
MSERWSQCCEHAEELKEPQFADGVWFINTKTGWTAVEFCPWCGQRPKTETGHDRTHRALIWALEAFEDDRESVKSFDFIEEDCPEGVRARLYLQVVMIRKNQKR